MYNVIQNDTTNILIFDTRTILSYLTGFISDLESSSTIPIPLDLLLQNKTTIDAAMKNIDKLIFKNPQYLQHKIINDKKVARYKARKRNSIFVVSLNTHNLSEF